MPVYQYRGRRYDTAAAMTGVRFAASKRDLAAVLRAEKIMPISMTQQGKKLSFPWPPGSVSGKDLALFTRQFSVMLDAGLPLVQCLGVVAHQQKNRVLKKALYQVQEDVEAGATLADALTKHPKIFDTFFVHMVSVGEVGGILEVILSRLSVFIEKNVKLKRAVLSASVYPSMVISVAMVVVIVIMIWVIPIFAALFEGLNAPLPIPTLLVMRASSLLGQFILPILAVFALSMVGFCYYYGTGQGRYASDRVALLIPVVGDVLRKIATARFARTLSTLLVSGIPILEGLAITAGSAGNTVIEKALLQARKEVEEGKSLIDPMKKTDLFPPMVIQMISVGEKTGELDQMLERLADYYEEEAETTVANFLTLLEPLIIVFLGVVVGGIVISMYLPIFSLIGHLAGV